MGTVAENFYPFRNPGDSNLGVVDPTVVASTTNMPAPKALVTTVSGTVALTLITVPYAGFTGTIKYLPTGAFTGVTGATGATGLLFGIGKAFTAVVGRPLSLTFDGALWYPGY